MGKSEHRGPNLTDHGFNSQPCLTARCGRKCKVESSRKPEYPTDLKNVETTLEKQPKTGRIMFNGTKVLGEIKDEE